jgi:hypothetical protein
VVASFSTDADRSTSGGVLALPPSKRAASDAVLSGRTVACVEAEELRVGEGMFRVGDGGSSAVLERLFSHAGGFCEALLAVDCRRVACEGVVGVSFGFSGELLGVKGRTVDGEASRIDPGLRNGDWRGLLEKRGEGLYGVGVVDCSELAATRSLFSRDWRTMVLNAFWCSWAVLQAVMSLVFGCVDGGACPSNALQTRQTCRLQIGVIDKAAASESGSKRLVFAVLYAPQGSMMCAPGTHTRALAHSPSAATMSL